VFAGIRVVQEAQQKLVAVHKHALWVMPSEEQRHALGDNMAINFGLDIHMGWFVRRGEMCGRVFGS
jgi:hypothetical protein